MYYVVIMWLFCGYSLILFNIKYYRNITGNNTCILAMDYNTYYQTITQFIDEYIKNFPLELHDQLQYLFTDGKHIRPILSMAFANIIDTSSTNNKKIILSICCTIELIHCISLVIDDLPELDNDDTRRNKPTFHIKYGYDYTKFFIYYILNKSSTILNKLLDEYMITDNACELNIRYARDILYLFEINLDNLIDGQYMDLHMDTECIDKQTHNTDNINLITTTNTNNILMHNLELYNVIYDIIFCFLDEFNENNLNINLQLKKDLRQNVILNIKKTGTLFALSTGVGHLLNLWSARINYSGKEYIIDDTPEKVPYHAKNTSAIDNKVNKPIRYSGNTDNVFNVIAIWGYILGYAFQISDDILDYENDIIKNKPNICKILGINMTHKLFHACYDWLITLIDIINENLNRLWGICFNKDVIYHILEKIKKRIIIYNV